MALLLTRKIDEAIVIDTPYGQVRIVPLRIERDRVLLAIEAPECIMVLREELLPLRVNVKEA